MAKVLLITLYPDDAGSWELGPFKAFYKSAKLSKHTLVTDPHDADVIFFTDEGRYALNDLFNTPLYKQFWNKCFVFSQSDLPIPMIPGLYASIQKCDYDPSWCRTGFYARECPSGNNQIYGAVYNEIPLPQNPNYLCSFAGSCQNSKIREKLKEIRHPRCLVIDVNRETNIANATHNQLWIKRLQTQFVSLLQNTKFSLCPRGIGTNSWRLYESMAMGRAPVILSDHWVAPKEIPWEDFSIRIAERDYKIIPEILEEHEHRAQELGLKARQTWEHHFLPNGIFDRAISTFLEIQASGKTKNWHQHQFRRLRMLPRILRRALHATRVRIQRGS
jgi:hypothetical protein